MGAEASRSQDRSRSPFLLIHNGRRVLIARPASYQEMLAAVRNEFPETRAKQVILQTKEMDVCEGEFTDITESSWDVIVDHISSVTVTVKEQFKQIPGNSTNIIIVNVEDQYTRRRRRFKVKTSARISEILNMIANGSSDVELRHNGSVLHPDAMVGFLGIVDGDTLYSCDSTRVGKPVIYLFSPETLDVSVSLVLVPDWELSAVYPVVPIKSTLLGQQITWDVRTKSNGDLTERTSGLDVSYLFWEAEADPSRPMSPPPSPALGAQPSNIASFRPILSDLSDGDSVLLSTATMTPYLDEALTVLGLHTEARTSFITYWLPSLLKHSNVALRFVPQSAYEQAARLDVLPAPDVVTRIFMLFKGISDDETLNWPTAKAKATSGVEWWQDVVGINREKALDHSLYRLLEWGGMEVLRK